MNILRSFSKFDADTLSREKYSVYSTRIQIFLCVILATLCGPLCGDLYFQTAPWRSPDTSCIAPLQWFWSQVVFYRVLSCTHKLAHMGFWKFPFTNSATEISDPKWRKLHSIALKTAIPKTTLTGEIARYPQKPQLLKKKKNSKLEDWYVPISKFNYKCTGFQKSSC